MISKGQKNFYSDMFGWKFEKFTFPDGMDNLMIITTDEQGKGYWWRNDKEAGSPNM